MIRIESLSKKYNKEYALKNASFTLDKNVSLAIIGPSGSGKSTLLRLINYLEEPTSGHVYINDTKLTLKNRTNLCLKIGMVFQQCHLFPHMNVLENLTYAPRNILKMGQIKAIEKAMGLLEHFNLVSKAQAMPGSLSGGQKQRIAIARALMMDPEMLLFDEPTSALDPEVIKDVAAIINELKKDMTIITVTHHLRFAHAIADRIIFMDEGQLLCDQNTKDFFDKPKSHRAKLFMENVGDFM